MLFLLEREHVFGIDCHPVHLSEPRKLFYGGGVDEQRLLRISGCVFTEPLLYVLDVSYAERGKVCGVRGNGRGHRSHLL